MKKITWILVFLALAITFGAFIQYEPGYVLLAFDQWSVETSVWVFLIVLLITLCILRFVFKLLKSIVCLPSNWHAWSSDHKMKKVQQLNPAKILIADEHYGAAQIVLEKMHTQLGDTVSVLNLLKTVYLKQHNWPALLSILPALHKQQGIDDLEYQALSETAYQAIFSTLTTSDDIIACWKKVPYTLKSSPLLLRIYTDQLLMHPESQNQVEKILKKSLQEKWDLHLIENYAKVKSAAPEKLLHHAEKWFEEDATRPGLALALAKLNLQQKIWGKAQYYLEYLIEKQPSPKAYYLLATLNEQLGNKAASNSCWQAGLALAVQQGV